MAATVAPSGHVITQSEQFFGGYQFAISMDHNTKNTWSCPSCGCNNMGKSKLCGLCGILNPKYIVKPKDMHKKSMVTKQHTKLLNSKDIYKKMKSHFPKFQKYKTISTPSINKTSKSNKSPYKNVINNLDLTISPRNHARIFNFNTINPQYPNRNPNIEQDTISFIDSVFGDINFNNPFGVVTEEIEIPTIISDEDEEDLPLTPASENSNDNDNDINQPFNESLADRLNNVLNGIDTITMPEMPPKHLRQVSISAPNTPPSRIKRKERDRIKVKKNVKPLLFGVIHTPAPSKKDRLNIVLKNIEHIIKFEFNGAFFINHGYSANHLVQIIKDVHKKYPKLWLGANLLGVPETKIFKFVKSNKLHKILKGVWCATSGIELDEDQLNNIFVHNFKPFKTKNGNIQYSFKNKPELKDNNDEPVCELKANESNASAVSTTSTKSNGSDNKNKKRVTFSGGTPISPGTDSPIILKPIVTDLNGKDNKQMNNKKKDDTFARGRLNRMSKYKFNGMYFGGVDLKSSKCIKIPTQKSIRTRRRTYSATSDVIGGKYDRGTGSPRSPKADSIIKRYKRSKKVGNRSNRSKSHHSGTPTKTNTKSSKSKRKDSIQLRKSLSSNIVTDESNMDELNVLATIQSSEDERIGTPIPKHNINANDYQYYKGIIKHSIPIPKSMKTKSTPTYNTKNKFKIIPKSIKKNKSSNIHHKKNQKYTIKKKIKKRKSIKNKSNNYKSKNNKNKQIYAMTDSEIVDDDAIDATFFIPSNILAAKSLELTEVQPKSPITPLSSGSMESSPPPLPSTPTTTNDKNNANPLSNHNIKLHNLALHKPLNNIEYENENDSNGNFLMHSHSMPHRTQLSNSNDSNFSISSSGNGSDENVSVYSHTSQLSETWSEYGSVNETLDDYHEALNKLGKFASRGYMDVITTSGKGKNIETKIKALKEACHKKCLLAVASGIRIENLECFLPYVDILMVSTCISNDFHKFDCKKMAKFKRTVDNYFKNV